MFLISSYTKKIWNTLGVKKTDDNKTPIDDANELYDKLITDYNYFSPHDFNYIKNIMNKALQYVESEMTRKDYLKNAESPYDGDKLMSYKNNFTHTINVIDKKEEYIMMINNLDLYGNDELFTMRNQYYKMILTIDNEITRRNIAYTREQVERERLLYAQRVENA